MSTFFLANPVKLNSEGQHLIDQSVEFSKNVEKMYNAIHQMVGKSYVSSAARALASDTEKYHNDFDKMANTIRRYGNYCIQSAGAINKNEQNIVTNNIRGGQF